MCPLLRTWTNNNFDLVVYLPYPDTNCYYLLLMFTQDKQSQRGRQTLLVNDTHDSMQCTHCSATNKSNSCHYFSYVKLQSHILS